MFRRSRRVRLQSNISRWNHIPYVKPLPMFFNRGKFGELLRTPLRVNKLYELMTYVLTHFDFDVTVGINATNPKSTKHLALTSSLFSTSMPSLVHCKLSSAFTYHRQVFLISSLDTIGLSCVKPIRR
jgi:hypothetical protein